MRVYPSHFVIVTYFFVLFIFEPITKYERKKSLEVPDFHGSLIIQHLFLAQKYQLRPNNLHLARDMGRNITGNLQYCQIRLWESREAWESSSPDEGENDGEVKGTGMVTIW